MSWEIKVITKQRRRIKETSWRWWEYGGLAPQFSGPESDHLRIYPPIIQQVWGLRGCLFRGLQNQRKDPDIDRGRSAENPNKPDPVRSETILNYSKTNGKKKLITNHQNSAAFSIFGQCDLHRSPPSRPPGKLSWMKLSILEWVKTDKVGRPVRSWFINSPWTVLRIAINHHKPS